MWPIWKALPPWFSHELAPYGLALYSDLFKIDTPLWSPLTWRGISFSNRLGIAAGLDKNADHLLTWQNLGAGFVEIGTVTPRPQLANSGKIIDRNWEEKILWNKMGFPSAGAFEVQMNLSLNKNEIHLPIFGNIGKNRATALNFATEDYIEACQRLAHWVDAIVVNVSSPNTVGLRDLQNKKHLQEIVKSTCNYSLGKPVLAKLSPDLSEAELFNSIEGALEGGASGFVLTNTTQFRPENSPFPKEGGLSGKTLAPLSKSSLEKSIRFLGQKRKDLLIISVGGVLTPSDVQERISMGADLVQIYSALVFNGPSFFRQVSQHYGQS